MQITNEAARVCIAQRSTCLQFLKNIRLFYHTNKSDLSQAGVLEDILSFVNCGLQLL